MNNRRLLLIGNSGTGKTRFIGSMPAPHVYDFDAGTDVLMNKVQVTAVPPDHDGWKFFRAKLEEWRKGVIPQGIETFALDSLTMAADAALTYVLKKNSRLGMQPTVADWGEAIREVKDVLAILTTLSKHVHVVVTAHTQLVKDELMGDIQWLPLIYGKDLPHRLGIFFDDVFLTTIVSGVKEGKKVTEYRLQVKPDTRLQIVKTRLDPDGTIFDFYEKPEFTHLLTKAGVIQTVSL